MLTVRPIRNPEDIPSLTACDTAFTTDRIYRVVQTDRAFALEEAMVESPLRKAYPPAAMVEELPRMDYAAVAELDGNVVGCATVKYEPWNRRATLWHLYVSAPWRRRGVGRALVDAVVTFSRSVGSRCVWLETQNVNFPAIGFYRAAGFRFCGLDTSLYDPRSDVREEIALFFVYDLVWA